jgi:uncharacterized protein DUF3467
VAVRQQLVSNTEEMTPGQPQPKLHLANTPDYRESYANSVQMRVSLWDFFLMFGTVNQTAPDSVTIHNFQGVYLSPPQAKALSNLLAQNLKQYEAAFGEIRLEAQASGDLIQ